MESSDSPVGSFVLTHNLSEIFYIYSMSLTKCPDCGQKVSEHAGTCIHCGNPLHAKPQEIELTNKRYKKRALIFVAILILGAILFLKGHWEIGLILYFIAFVGGMINRFMAWWNNG